MARVKRGVHAKKHHKAVLEQAKGYYGNKSRTFRSANEQVNHSLRYAFRDRRAHKGDMRRHQVDHSCPFIKHFQPSSGDILSPLAT